MNSESLSSINIKNTKNFTALVFLILLVMASGTALYFYQQVRVLKQDPNAVARQEVTAVVAKAGRLMVLPEGEVTIATVTDPEKLKDQPFFANAKKGFKLLLYTTAQKAILYDPFEDKIVEVAPLSLTANKSVNPEIIPQAIKEPTTKKKK